MKLVFPSFSLAGEPLVVVKKVKYLGHVIRDDLCDDDVRVVNCMAGKHAGTQILHVYYC